MPADWLWGLVGGVMIGSAAAIYLLGNGRIMGISGIIGGLVDGSARSQWAERGAFIAALVLVPAMMHAFAATPPQTHLTSNLALVLGGGFLVGMGTRIGSGCTSGHGVCGISRLSLRSILATGVFISVGVLTVALLRAVGE